MILDGLTVNDIVEKFGKDSKDTGNISVQVAILTKKINHLSKHLSDNKKDNANKRTLLIMVGQRRRRLRYLQSTDLESYRSLIKSLELRH